MYKVLVAVIFASVLITAKSQDVTESHDATTEVFTDFVKQTTPKGTNDEHPYYTYTINNQCECSIFNTSTPSLEDKPIIAHTNIRVHCNDNGEQICLKLCVALALVAYKEAPKLICGIVGYHDNLEVFLHSRICYSEAWTYTGLSRNNMCCYEYEHVECDHYDHIYNLY